MIEIEIDGKKVQASEGSSVIEAAQIAGTYIPHFCYHKKLSVAASCRMCLVDVEKIPKPVPACATTISDGMKVTTRSDKAVAAQRSVMEFLLINHPLDCPVCDQGGECQLQDLAVGYGVSSSRYQEQKRVVFNKNLGSLVSTDMTRCIHCTRCVRFGQEIAGVMELGVAFRGEHAEVMAFVERSVESELSGNIIDLCPVGALTSKPFRFSARSWEMARRQSVSPHDSLGSNVVVQVQHNTVKRVLPLENESLNECWLSDRDRFSYEALHAKDRLLNPKIKYGGQWHTVDWQTALEYVTKTLRGVSAQHGAQAIGALVSPNSTLEEMHLTQKLMRGFGVENIDFRLRQTDFSLDTKRQGAPWLGLAISELNQQDAVLVVGSFLRKDHPLLALRLRQAVKKGCKLSRVHCTTENWLTHLNADVLTAPDQMLNALAQIVKALAEQTGQVVSDSCNELVASVIIQEEALKIAKAFVSGQKNAILLGNFAVQHPNYGSLHILAQEIARLASASLGVIGEAANTVGGYLAKALPSETGKNAAQMLNEPLKAYFLVGAEPILDCADGVKAKAALMQAESVIYMGAFVGDALDYADAMLPVAPFTETSGTYVNTEGRAQSFNAVVKPSEDVRPAWKVLRVLGNMLGLEGFDMESVEDVLRDALPNDVITEQLNNSVTGLKAQNNPPKSGLQRIADIPVYAADSLVRRASSLQKTNDAQVDFAKASPATLQKANIQSGDSVRIKSSNGEIVTKIKEDASIAFDCIKISAAHPSFAKLGHMFDSLEMEKA